MVFLMLKYIKISDSFNTFPQVLFCEVLQAVVTGGPVARCHALPRAQNT